MANAGYVVTDMSDTLQALAEVLEQRKGADPEGSYVAGLYAQGLDGILKKVGEEAAEVIIAGKGDDDAAVVRETADLWFHTMVLLAARNQKVADVIAELERRFGVSGLQEKQQRSTGEGA